MRHSCSSCVSGLVITSISPLSTSCFSIKRPPWPLTTTVSQVSRNFFPLWPRPCACTRILRNTRELRRGEAAVTSLLVPIVQRPPSYRQSAPPDRCSPTATRRKTANGHLCYERGTTSSDIHPASFADFPVPRLLAFVYHHRHMSDCPTARPSGRWPGCQPTRPSFFPCNHTSRLVSQSPELVCGRSEMDGRVCT